MGSDDCGGYLDTGHGAAGVEVAGTWHGLLPQNWGTCMRMPIKKDQALKDTARPIVEMSHAWAEEAVAAAKPL